MDRAYTLAQVAKISGVPESDLQELIQSGQLMATFSQGSMTYLVAQDEVARFLTARKMGDRIEQLMKHRVLVVDRNTEATFILKAELERAAKIEVVVATASRDVAISLDKNLPDLIAMHFGAIQRHTDNLSGVLRWCREARPIKLILYHDQPDALLKESAEVQRAVQHFKVDAVVSVAKGMKPLIDKTLELMGLVKPTKMWKPQAPTS